MRSPGQRAELPGPCSGLVSRKGRAVKDVPQTRRRASARFPSGLSLAQTTGAQMRAH